MALETHIVVFTDYDSVVWQVVYPFQSNMLPTSYILEMEATLRYTATTTTTTT
jgi:hypothetical protein